MGSNKKLDEELGIKHIPRPKELPRVSIHKDKYSDPDYPYESTYIHKQPKKKKVSKKRSYKKVVKKEIVKESFLKKLFKKLGW